MTCNHGQIQKDDMYTCEEQSSFGKCSEEWMIDGYFCAYSCGRCSSQTQTSKGDDESWKSTLKPIPVKDAKKEESECKDIEPSNSGDSCESIKKWGSCGTLEKGYCQLTCGTCKHQDINIFQQALQTLADYSPLKQQIDNEQGKAEKRSLVDEHSEATTKSAIKDNQNGGCVDAQPIIGGNCTTYKNQNKCDDEHLINNNFCAKIAQDTG
eukprot:TRINITY_DN7672_c0_g4_i1.p2 TRINITY_DN7672_c0_g4~~TRINITY_DN7672_c0_g4_i1.p2  ORF type:complete len:210 (-),score=20.70 TRINITY_DN7672_c0_g4_i1:52-681(-)